MKRFGIVRVLNVQRAFAIVERVDTADGVLCLLSAVDRELTIGATVAFDQVMSNSGKHLAKNARVVRE